MSDIEVVIKINKDFIDKMNSIKDDRELSWSQLLTVYRGFHAMLQHGTPLPKGHGKLKDADKLLETWYDDFCEFMTQAELDSMNNIIKKAPTIIEADKEESELKE